jgi:hypothetical protein
LKSPGRFGNQLNRFWLILFSFGVLRLWSLLFLSRLVSRVCRSAVIMWFWLALLEGFMDYIRIGQVFAKNFIWLPFISLVVVPILHLWHAFTGSWTMQRCLQPWLVIVRVP